MSDTAVNTKKKAVPEVNYKKCTGCSICITACPFSSLELTVSGIDAYKTLYPGLGERGKKTCTGCGICAKECPIDAIAMV